MDWTPAVVLCFALGLTPAVWSNGEVAYSPGEAENERLKRLERVGDEILELERSLGRLEGQERGVLGELERLDSELRLRQQQLRAAGLRLDGVRADITRQDATLARIDEAQSVRRSYLAFRLREIYKAGSEQTVHRVLGGRGIGLGWSGLGYASYLSKRDLDVLEAFSADEKRSALQRSELEQSRDELQATNDEIDRRRDRVVRMRRERAASLEQIRQDESRHDAALEELRAAAEELGRLAVELGGELPAPDVNKFKGLLEWPTEGRVRSGFGTVVHPEFKTKVPHPGWDIEADFGAPIVTIFDGRVVFSDWMRGYGLTAIVDHGGGLLSIYAHASALVVETDETVARGQQIGSVGDTGSLSGAFLYFELRIDGKPTDPEPWLRHP